MEELISHAQTLPGLLAALTVVSGLRLFSHAVDFLWKMRERKDVKVQKALETLAGALRQNTDRLKGMELTLATAARLKIDVRRLRAAVRILAGDDWEDVWAQVLEEERAEAEDAA